MVAVYANQLEGKLKPLPPLVLLWGDDAGALRQAAQAVAAATGVDPANPFAAEKFGIMDIAADSTRLVDSAGTLTFGGGHRLITVGGVTGEERHPTLPNVTEAVKTLLAMPLEGVTVILSIPYLLEKSSAIVKAVEKHPQALCVRFYADAARDLTSFLQNEFKALGKPVEAEALRQMAAGLGADREIARREVEKVVLYAGNESPVTAAHVTASLAGAVPANAFLLAEAVASRNPAQTDALLTRLAQQGEDLTAAFSLTLNHLAGLAAAQKLKAEGVSESTILQQTGKIRAPKAAQAAFLSQVNAYPAKRLATLPQYAIDALTQARSGLIDANLVLSRALLALAA